MAEYEQEVAQVEELVARATDEQLSGPEWALNMEICDCANENPEVCDDIVRFLQRRLQSESPRVTLLALVLTETVVKNGSPAIHAQVGSRAFLSEVAALTDGSLGIDVQSHALLLIRQWANAFKANSDLAAFQDVYRQLKMQGVSFPEAENDAPIFTPPSSTPRPPTIETGRGSFAMHGEGGYAAAGGDASTPASTREQQLLKLHADLKVVQEKTVLLRSLRARGEAGEPLEDVLDFLRQCQPRMNTLIEGGIMGKIDEQTLEDCLNVNDNLMKALEECSGNKAEEDLIRFDSPPRAASSRETDLLDSMDELNLQDRGRASASGSAAAASTTHRPTTSPRSTLTSMDDEFDSFLNTRPTQ